MKRQSEQRVTLSNAYPQRDSYKLVYAALPAQGLRRSPYIRVAFAFPLGCRRKEVTRGRIKPAGVFPSKQICHGNESLFFFFLL